MDLTAAAADNSHARGGVLSPSCSHRVPWGMHLEDRN